MILLFVLGWLPFFWAIGVTAVASAWPKFDQSEHPNMYESVLVVESGGWSRRTKL